MRKMRQDVAAHLFTQHKTACLLTLSPLACRKAACSEPVKRRFRAWSGRRDSNPRQPAWKADRREITGRLFSSGLRRAFTNRTCHLSSIEADGRARWEADAYLPSPIIPSPSQESKLYRKDVLCEPVSQRLGRFSNAVFSSGCPELGCVAKMRAVL